MAKKKSNKTEAVTNCDQLSKKNSLPVEVQNLHLKEDSFEVANCDHKPNIIAWGVIDITKHNSQYAPIEVKQFNKAHDRFLLIDDAVYHIGASIKDLGKKWFAFTLMKDLTAGEILSKI